MRDKIQHRLDARIKERDHLKEIHQQLSQKIQSVENDLITATLAVQELTSLLSEDEERGESSVPGGE